jgi:methyl-accepting chemotaxis protein
MKEKLEFKIFSTGAVILIIGVIIINIFVYRMEKSGVQSLSKERLAATSKIVTKAIEHSMVEGKAYVTERLVRDIKSLSDFDYIEVYNSEGREAFNPNASIVEAEALKHIAVVGAYESSEGESRIIYRMPLENVPTCRDCHAGEGQTLGLVKLAVSLEREYEKITDFMIFMTVGSLLGLGALGFLSWQILNRFVMHPIRQLEASASKMSEGDLHFMTDIDTKDEVGRLDRSIKESLMSISGILRRVREVSKRMASSVETVEAESAEVVKSTQLEAEATSEISSSVEQLNSAVAEVADSTESLANSVEETASSMEEMSITTDSLSKITREVSEGVDATSSSIEELSATIKEVADNAGELAQVSDQTLSAVDEIISSVKEVETSAKSAATLSQKVKDDASTLGVSSINKTIEGMERIRESVTKTSGVVEKLVARSEEIGNILNVIDDITDQTTLLALNAAILAAQAGEHGKGFSVVANEIKDLAEKTAFSTKEIDQLIMRVRQDVQDAVVAMDEGMGSVEEGLSLSKEASVALRNMLNSATQSSEMSISIERTTAEQAKTAMYVSESVERVRIMVGQIAKATAEQSRGVTLIMDAAEKIRDASHQVDKATEQQAVGGRQVANAIEVISDKSKHISKAIREQKMGARQIWTSLEKIKNLPEKNRRLAYGINRELSSMSKDSELIIIEMERFKLYEEKDSGVITFGVVPFESPVELFRKFSYLASYLSKEVGKRVELRVANDFQTAVDEFRKGITQFCFMTSGTYLEASKKPGIELLTRVLRKGKPYHRSVIIARKDSPIETLKDLKGKSIAFVDRYSASGNIVPRAMLLEEGIGMDDLSFHIYLGHHDDVAKAVLKGEFDAGTILESIAAKFTDRGLKVIKASPEIPEFNICSSIINDVDKAAVRTALLALNEGNPDTTSVLGHLDDEYSGFTEASDNDYDSIKAMISKVENV